MPMIGASGGRTRESAFQGARACKPLTLAVACKPLTVAMAETRWNLRR